MSESSVIFNPSGHKRHSQDDAIRYEPAIRLEPLLRQFLAERFSYKRNYVDRVGYTLSAKTMQYDLYLRVFGHKTDFWPESTLVIARIGFKNIQNGHGTALLSFLVEHAAAVGYAWIAIESANASAEAFALKLGFENHGSNHFIVDVASVRNQLLTRKPAAATTT